MFHEKVYTLFSILGASPQNWPVRSGEQLEMVPNGRPFVRILLFLLCLLTDHGHPAFKKYVLCIYIFNSPNIKRQFVPESNCRDRTLSIHLRLKAVVF